MVDLDIPHVSSEAATALVDLLRKQPGLKEVIAPPLPRALKYVTESSGKTSIIYLLGECGDVVREAPYCLEKLIDSYDNIKSADVKIALLTSTMKLFFQRAPEVQKMLGRLLLKATEDVTSQDLHDRALLYYRLLKTAVDPKVVRDILATNSTISGASKNFAEESCDDDFRQVLMQEFNTLSIVYGATSDNFIAEEYQVKLVKLPRDHPLDAGAPPAESLQVNELADEMQQTSLRDNNDTAPSVPAAVTSAVPAPAPAPEVDLLGFSSSEPTPAPVHAPAATLTLNPAAALSGEEYQSMWGAISDADAHVIILPLSLLPASTNVVEEPLAGLSIKTMASGELESELKFFLYGQDSSPDSHFYLVQASISKTSSPPEMFLTVKANSSSNDRQRAEQFVDVMKAALSSFVQ